MFSAPLKQTASVACFLLLSACIKIDITQTIDKTGKMQMVLVYDFSAFLEMAEQMNEQTSSSSAGATEDLGCDNFWEDQKENQKKELANAKCEEVSPGVMRITATQKLPRSQFTKRMKNGKAVYILRIHAANKLVTSQEQSVTQGQEEADWQTEAGEGLAESIISGTVSITMPARITKSPGGAIAGNTVTFKFSDFPLKRSGFIQAEE